MHVIDNGKVCLLSPIYLFTHGTLAELQMKEIDICILYLSVWKIFVNLIVCPLFLDGTLSGTSKSTFWLYRNIQSALEICLV